MKLTALQDRPDWPQLRIRLGEMLKRRALDHGLDASALASKMGHEPRRIRQLFKGGWRSPERYEHMARTLGWSVQKALGELEVDMTTETQPENNDSILKPRLLEAPEITTHPPSQENPSASDSTRSDPDPFPYDIDHTPQENVSRRSKAPKKPAANPTFANHRTRLAGELRALVEASSKSQSAWAQVMGVSQSTISSVLAARHKRRNHFDSLAHALGYSIDAEFSLTPLPPTPPPFQTRPDPELHSFLDAQDLEAAPETSPEPSPTPVSGEPARLALDPSLEALIEWSAAQRGIEPQIWLTLAVAAYYEEQTER